MGNSVIKARADLHKQLQRTSQYSPFLKAEEFPTITHLNTLLETTWIPNDGLMLMADLAGTLKKQRGPRGGSLCFKDTS